jgi:hypothetical protein
MAVTGQLNPMWAAAAMTVSSILVIGNSLRLANSEGSRLESVGEVTNPGGGSGRDHSTLSTTATP